MGGNDNEKHESGQNISEQPKQNSNTKDLPEFLKQKLKARRILKDKPAKDNIPRNRLQSRSLQHYHQDASNKDAYDKDDDEDTSDYPSDKDASASHVAMLNIG
ncbi:hypothetical protein Tco_0043379 [Tanacetum coccineum]